MPKLEWRIDLSLIITVAGFLVTGGMGYATVSARQQSLEEVIREMRLDMKEIRRDLSDLRERTARCRE